MKQIALVVLLAAGILRFQMEKNSIGTDQLSAIADQEGPLVALEGGQSIEEGMPIAPMARGRTLGPTAHGPRARPRPRPGPPPPKTF